LIFHDTLKLSYSCGVSRYVSWPPEGNQEIDLKCVHSEEVV